MPLEIQRILWTTRMNATFSQRERCRTEAEINGGIIPYDLCDSSVIDNPNEYAATHNYTYLGSGHVIYINGKKNVYKDLHHFFLFNNKPNFGQYNDDVSFF